eukprot:CAMPEP_0202419000 /NCGR_PEP_ID=MMETSP1128-20130828/48035_1 /ASSEMBLY_ACC=CAM_ASM_000463 /TAXON_ID=3047 /ORGANISM="Dunaliella tertiolecta, Strain CCMP1320" /LENGTH=66 /DNA_ID=CAMNT_0049026827 /DNA_START=74 /DNA_END=270 /DNA_ORIENTATION=+
MKMAQIGSNANKGFGMRSSGYNFFSNPITTDLQMRRETSAFWLYSLSYSNIFLVKYLTFAPYSQGS